MQLSLADVIVEWVIYALRTFATLPAWLKMAPFASGREAEADRLVVKVEMGEQLLEADQCFPGTLTLKLKTTKRDATVANDIWAKVEAAMVAGLQTTGSNTRALTIFSRLDFLTEGASTSLDNTNNFRHYTRTIPLHAKLL